MKTIKGDDALAFAQIMHNINQDFKNASKDGEYTVFKGSLLSFSGVTQDLIHQKGTIKLAKKNQRFEDILKYYNGYIMGKVLFKFFEQYRKFITEIQLKDDSFTILTSVPEVEFSSMSIDNYRDKDLDGYKRFKKKAIDIAKTTKNLIGSKKLTPEFLKENAKNPIELEIKNIKIKMITKMFLGYKAKSEIVVRVYDLDSANSLYMVELILDNPNFKSFNYFVIVNY